MRIMQFRFLPLLASLMLLLFFAACKKDDVIINIEDPIIETPTTTYVSPVVARISNSGTQSQTNTSGLEIACISVDFPFGFVIDNQPFTISSVDELDSVFNNFFTVETENADFAYPLNVTLEDGSPSVVADADELSTLVSACIPSSGWGSGHFPAFYFDNEPCLSLSYPVTLEDFLTGEIITAVSESDFIDIIGANPSLFFVFPLNVIDSSGTVTSIDDMDLLFSAIAACSNSGSSGGPHSEFDEFFFLTGEGCFDYNYPINLVDENGNLVGIADDNELVAQILNGSFVNFDYSFTVTLVADGTQLTISDEDDFADLLGDCFDIDIIDEEVEATNFFVTGIFDSCYTIAYPVALEVNGATVVIANEFEALNFMSSNQLGFLVLPVNVTRAGQTITVEDVDDFNDLIESCFSIGNGNFTTQLFLTIGLDASCFELVYPFTSINTDSSISEITSEADAIDYLNSMQEGMIVFPVSVVEVSSGTTFVLNSEVDLIDLLSNC